MGERELLRCDTLHITTHDPRLCVKRIAEQRCPKHCGGALVAVAGPTIPEPITNGIRTSRQRRGWKPWWLVRGPVGAQPQAEGVMNRHGAHQLPPLTEAQLRAIWTLRSRLGLDEDALRDMVQRVSGQRSTRHLTAGQAHEVLEAMAGGTIDVVSRKDRHADLDGRPGMATAKQLRKIEALWADVSRAPDREKPQALRKWLANHFGVSDLRFIKRDQASLIIVALEKF